MRLFGSMNLVNSFGNGLFMATSTLFFVRSMGLSAGQLGMGLAVAGVCGVVAGIPMGWLADRWNSRNLLMTLLASEAAGMLCYTVIKGFPLFLLLTCVVTFVDRGAAAVRNALVADVLPQEARVSGRAYLRSITNIGIGVGAACAVAALHADTAEAYTTVIAVNSLTFGTAASMLFFLPRRGSVRPGDESLVTGEEQPPRRRAITDVPYLVVTALSGLLVLWAGVLEVGLPLWIVESTSAPRWTGALGFILNTVIVVLIQVRVSRKTETLARAAHCCFWAGVLIAVSCLLFAGTDGMAAVQASTVLLLGVVVFTLGEVLASAGTWALSYELADERSHGSYQGVFSAGFSAGVLLSPIAVTTTVVGFGAVGWLMFGAMLLIPGALLVPATRWAARRAHLGIR